MMHKAVYGLVCYVAVLFKSDLKLDPSSHLEIRLIALQTPQAYTH